MSATHEDGLGGRAFPVPVRVVMSLVAAFASLLGVRIGQRHSLYAASD